MDPDSNCRRHRRKSCEERQFIGESSVGRRSHFSWISRFDDCQFIGSDFQTLKCFFFNPEGFLFLLDVLPNLRMFCQIILRVFIPAWLTSKPFEDSHTYSGKRKSSPKFMIYIVFGPNLIWDIRNQNLFKQFWIDFYILEIEPMWKQLHRPSFF